MGQITADNQYDADYWKRQLYFLTGTAPQVVSDLHVTYTISVDDKLLPQEAIDALKSTYERNKKQGQPVEVENPPPSIEEREAAANFTIHERAMINEGRADETRLP